MDIKDQIKNHLFSIEPNIDWKKELTDFSKRAGECNKNLKKIQFFIEFRERERGRRLATFQLEKRWEEHLHELQKNYPGDPFYFPGDCANQKGQIFYFDDHNVNSWLGLLLTPNYKAISKDLAEMRQVSLALKKVFYLLSEEETPYLQRIFFFSEILKRIENIALHEWYRVLLKNKKIIEKSENARGNKKGRSIEEKIERYKKHESYAEIKGILGKHKSIEQVTQLDKALVKNALKKITPLKDRALRDHRDLIIEDFFNKD